MINVPKKDRVGTGGEYGLGSLDDLSEGHGTSTQGKHGEGVSQGSPETNGGKFFPVLHGHIRCFADTEEPLGYHEQHTNSELTTIKLGNGILRLIRNFKFNVTSIFMFGYIQYSFHPFYLHRRQHPM
jgi:hypothetical protein